MGKRHSKRIELAQNFLTNPQLVRRLVAAAAIGPDDTVLEIGAGRGIITAELARVAKHVIAIEKDPRFVRGLRERFRYAANVEIVECDFIRYRNHPRGCKVFANIPYNQTAAIVRKLLDTRVAPSEAFLIMQKEPARKFAGLPAETLFSLLAKPYYEFHIAYRLRRTDFIPVPDVDSVLLGIKRRAVPLVAREDAVAYADFVTYGFAGWKPNLRTAYKKVFTYNQWKRLAHDLSFPINATATQLTLGQWLSLFHAFRRFSLFAINKPR